MRQKFEGVFVTVASLMWIIFLFISLCYGTDARADDWTVAQEIEEGATVSTLMLDWHQTREIASHPCIHERNTLLGEHPRQPAINRYFGAVVVGQFVIADLLPGYWRDGFLGSITLLELDVIGKNKQIGLTWRF